VLVFVDGELSALFPEGTQLPAVPTKGRTYANHFGRIHLADAATVTRAGLADALTSAVTGHDANWALPVNRAPDWGKIAARGFRLPIPGVTGVPARAYLFILLAFACIIGPVNYVFLMRKRRQVLLVLTAPIISAVFIVLLAGYVLAGEGLGVRARAVTFTLLDQIRKEAVTRSSVSMYAAGMAPGGGLRYPRDLAVLALGFDGDGSREPQRMDLTEAQQFTAGAIQARTPANLEQVRFRAARERVNFSRDAAGVSVVNALGATVTALVYRDRTGVYSLAAALPPGGRATLKPGGLRGADVVPAGLPGTLRISRLVDQPPDGGYVAVLDRSPFWETGLKSVDERNSFHAVLGWPERLR
jgi:hypothetical protein